MPFFPKIKCPRLSLLPVVGGADGGVGLFLSSFALEERVMDESSVDDFEFVRYLGGGSEGAVLLARNTKPDHPFKEKVRARALRCLGV